VAVAEFMRWAKAPDDPASKSRFYPSLAKNTLVPDYIAEKSGHSKGATVDLGLLDCRSGVCKAVDMGTEFDFFGEQANTGYQNLTESQRQNRKKLVMSMQEQGFENYPMEWWHYTWKAEKLSDQAFSFPIQ
jgi:D-alanyl-D-alanine dipeptidase